MAKSQTGENAVPSRKNRARTRRLRLAVVLGVLAVYVVGLVLNAGLGSLCAFGVSGISAICPVGVLETTLAGGVVGVLPLIVLLLVIAGAILFGRAFCGWVCPVPPVRLLVTGKGEKAAWAADRAKAGCGACDACAGGSCASSEKRAPGRRLFKGALLSKNAASATGVLAVTLVTTVIFGFPVFCLVCPVGLVFATIFAFFRLVAFNELVIDVVVFPALIIAELVLLRHWCSKLCPIGAFLGLFAHLGRTFRPQVDTAKCLVTSRGLACDACHASCPSDIDLVRLTGSGAVADCTRCGECAAQCPVDAISFPFARTHAARCGGETLPEAEIEPEIAGDTSGR